MTDPDSFVEAALEDLAAARARLLRDPGPPASAPEALVRGDAAFVRDWLSADPRRAAARLGPRAWPPLLYVCFSRLASERDLGFASAAELLLEGGADPNSFYHSPHFPDCPLSALYGAAGLNNHPRLAAVLLAGGANPNDGESLYHSSEHSDLACFRLLLERGATPQGSNALKHMLDREEPEGLRLLLEHHADPNETNERRETALHWAVWRGRGPAIIQLLLDHGANPNYTRVDGRTPYALAVQSGQVESARLMEARGVDTELSVLDRFAGACARATPAELPGLLSNAPHIDPGTENPHLVADWTISGRTQTVLALLAAGLPVNAPGALGGTPLHWACWHGNADLARVLIARGASLTAEDPTYSATPAGWFFHGLGNCPGPRGDYVALARVLADARSPLPPGNLPTGDEAVNAVFRHAAEAATP